MDVYQFSAFLQRSCCSWLIKVLYFDPANLGLILTDIHWWHLVGYLTLNAPKHPKSCTNHMSAYDWSFIDEGMLDVRRPVRWILDSDILHLGLSDCWNCWFFAVKCQVQDTPNSRQLLASKWVGGYWYWLSYCLCMKHITSWKLASPMWDLCYSITANSFCLAAEIWPIYTHIRHLFVPVSVILWIVMLMQSLKTLFLTGC